MGDPSAIKIDHEQSSKKLDKNLGLKNLFFFVISGSSLIVVYIMATRGLHGR